MGSDEPQPMSRIERRRHVPEKLVKPGFLEQSSLPSSQGSREAGEQRRRGRKRFDWSLTSRKG
jgi:hypothetical protein